MTSAPISLPKVISAVEVLLDLRLGSLEGLAAYLKQERGIPDRGVALELRKLIVGTKSRSAFKLIVVDHPEKTKSRGGRPLKPPHVGDRDREIAAAFRRLASCGDAHASGVIAKQFEISKKQVLSIEKRVAKWEAWCQRRDDTSRQSAEELRALNLRREAAIRSLKMDN